MPIRAEERARYPKDWKTVVVPRIRARSGNRCECTGQCGAMHGDLTGRCPLINGETGYYDWRGDWHIMPPHERGQYINDDAGYARKIVEIVLTVMHLNHQPEDCRDENLLHGCQSCHNRYDAPVRAAGIKARRKAERAAGDFFVCEEVKNSVSPPEICDTVFADSGKIRDLPQ